MSGTTSLRLRTVVHIAVFTALIAVCAQIIIPAPIPFTMQTFGIFFAVVCLGGKHGTLAFLTYLLIGLIGIPVFSGFGSGIGLFFGPTGGYLLGFLVGDLILWTTERFWRQNTPVLLLCMGAALVSCYLFGTVWYMTVYSAGADRPAELLSVLGTSVFPYVLPDIAKLLLIFPIRRKLDKARLFR